MGGHVTLGSLRRLPGLSVAPGTGGGIGLKANLWPRENERGPTKWEGQPAAGGVKMGAVSVMDALNDETVASGIALYFRPSHRFAQRSRNCFAAISSMK